MQKFMRILFLTTIIILLLCGCNHKGEDELNRAEVLLNTHPDSAMTLLNKVGKSVDEFSHRNRMRYLLMRTEAMNKTFVPLDTVSYIDPLLDYFKSHGSRDEKMRTYYMAGSVYRDRGNSPMALQYFNEAVNLADTTRTDCDFALLSRIYGQMAEIFEKQRYPQKELEVLKDAAACAIKAKDTLVYIENLVRMGGAYRNMGNMTKALQKTWKSYNEYNMIGRKDLSASVLALVIDHYLKTDSLDMAKKSIDEYRNNSGLFDKKGKIMPGCEIFYFYMGKYYEKKAENDSALWYYRKLIRFNKEISNLENGYKGLLSIYQRLHQPDSVAKYANLYSDANDSANFQNSANEVSRMQALFDYSDNQRIANEKTIESWHYKLSVCIACVVLIILAVTSYIYIRLTKIRNHMQAMKMNNLYSETLSKYSKNVKDLELLREDHDKFEKSKLAEIDELLKKLEFYKRHFSDKEKAGIEAKLLEHEIINRLHVKAKKGEVMSYIEWFELKSVMEESLPEFMYALANKEPLLSVHEINICVLVRLRFNPSEISSLLGFTPQRVSNIRSRLNVKLFGQTGTQSFDSNILRM